MRWYSIGPSQIHGRGHFAIRPNLPGDFIEDVNRDGFQTELVDELIAKDWSPGFNHSCEPNLRRHIRQEGSGWEVLRSIAPGDELTFHMWETVGLFGPDPIGDEEKARMVRDALKCNCNVCRA